MATTIDYSKLPYTGHTGILVNDHLRGQLARTPQVAAIRKQQEMKRLQQEEFARKHEQEKQDLQSARNQIAAIAAAQAQAAQTPTTKEPASEQTEAVSGWRRILSR